MVVKMQHCDSAARGNRQNETARAVGNTHFVFHVADSTGKIDLTSICAVFVQ